MANSNEYMRVYMINRYHDRKREAIELLGGHCFSCGSTQSLDHIDPSKKSFSLSRMWSVSVSRERYFAELQKCQLLCYDCHLIKTSDDIGVEHGGGVSGKKNCLCDKCRVRKNEYMQRYHYSLGPGR